MAVYRCTSCEQQYCDSCEPGEDMCIVCGTGPRCDDCAYEHEAYEQARADEDEDEDDSPEARS